MVLVLRYTSFQFSTLYFISADGSAIISRVETHMTDGTTRVCDSISPETAQLLSQLTPKMFTHQNITQVRYNTEYRLI